MPPGQFEGGNGRVPLGQGIQEVARGRPGDQVRVGVGGGSPDAGGGKEGEREVRVSITRVIRAIVPQPTRVGETAISTARGKTDTDPNESGGCAPILTSGTDGQGTPRDPSPVRVLGVPARSAGVGPSPADLPLRGVGGDGRDEVVQVVVGVPERRERLPHGIAVGFWTNSQPTGVRRWYSASTSATRNSVTTVRLAAGRCTPSADGCDQLHRPKGPQQRPHHPALRVSWRIPDCGT